MRILTNRNNIQRQVIAKTFGEVTHKVKKHTNMFTAMLTLKIYIMTKAVNKYLELIQDLKPKHPSSMKYSVINVIVMHCKRL